jgi:LDH2 family malate/lactate/ureidoglycolate dehydrogenase
MLSPGPIKIVKDDKATCLIDGAANLGAVVSMFAMKEAMKRAKEYGIGMSLVYNSSHFGAAAYYTRYAAQNQFIGFCSTSALVNLAPWGSLDMIVGKNPFSISFPGDEFPVVLDIACSVAARQKVKALAREGLPIPEGWALDRDGNPTTDANAALEGVFLPMAGHKGIGIAIMMEYLTAVLCGTGYSETVLSTTSLFPSRILHTFLLP